MKKFNKSLLISSTPLLFTPLIATSCNLSETINGNKYVQLRSNTLIELNIPDHITEIEPTALFLRSKLEKVNSKNIAILPKDLFRSGKDNIGANSSLKEVSFKAVKAIENETFKGLINLEKVDMPLVTEIGDSAFENTPKLSSLFVSPITKLGKNAFKGAKSLIQFPALTNQITELAEGVFSETALTEFSNENIIAIGNAAFKNSKIEKIIAPKVTKIGKEALMSQSLKEIKFSENAQFDPLAFGSNSAKAPQALFDQNGLLTINHTLFLINKDKATSLIKTETRKVKEKDSEKEKEVTFTTLTLPNEITTVNVEAFSQHRNKFNKLIARGVKIADQKQLDEFTEKLNLLGITDIELAQ